MTLNIEGEFIIGNEDNAQVEANMDVVHNILNGERSIVPQRELAMVA